MLRCTSDSFRELVVNLWTPALPWLHVRERPELLAAHGADDTELDAEPADH